MNMTMETETSQAIDHSMLVSDINRQFPQCRPVFEKYGLAGCGGADGPPEPLFIFAAAHRIALPALVAELNQAVRGEWKVERGVKSEEQNDLELEQLYKKFVFAAMAVALTVGFGLGLVNLVRICFAQSYFVVAGTLKQFHGHAQIFGWAGLFIMGVAYHAVPRMKMQSLRPLWAATASLWLILAGIALRMFGFRISALLELAGIGLFAWLIAGVVARSEQKREPYEKFIWASVGWFLALGIWNVWILWKGVPALQNALWIHAAFFGFIANMIFGFSLRVLPHFMGLRETKAWAANAAFWIWNAAVLVRYPTDGRSWSASWMELVAALLFVYALGVFARRRVKIDIKGVDNTFAWFVLLGYIGLLIAVLSPLHADHLRLSASSRHLMALGFITPMILGVAYRVLPIFNGVNLWSNRLLRVSFWHLAAGTTLSFAMAFNKAYETPWSYAWSGVAGTLVFAAVAMFAVNIAMTLRSKTETFSLPVKPTTRVADLLEHRPESRPVLIHAGLAKLPAHPPRFVTIEFAARRHGIDPLPLINLINERLNHEIRVYEKPRG